MHTKLEVNAGVKVRTMHCNNNISITITITNDMVRWERLVTRLLGCQGTGQLREIAESMCPDQLQVG